MTNIWKSLLGKEQRGEEGRENMPGLIVRVSSGGYAIDELSQVLVVILLRRTWVWGLTWAPPLPQLTGDIPELNVQHPRRRAGVSAGAPHLTLLPQYLFLITVIIFSNICCFSYFPVGVHRRGCGALQVGHVSHRTQPNRQWLHARINEILWGEYN